MSHLSFLASRISAIIIYLKRVSFSMPKAFQWYKWKLTMHGC